MNLTEDSQTAEPAILKPKDTQQEQQAWISLFLAWGFAVVSTLGALFVGEVMGQTPCVVCWYQRAFMFPLAIILGVAAFRSDFTAWRYSIPLAGIGALLALYHSLLYVGVISETLSPCSRGVSCASEDMVVLGLLPLPILSLGSFLAIAALIYFSKRRAAS